MNGFRKICLLVLAISPLVGLMVPQIGLAQRTQVVQASMVHQAPYFEVSKVFKPLSISKDQLNTAVSLPDLNKHYKEKWVREYISVEVSASVKGTTQKARSKNSTLTSEQKRIMHLADVGSDISVVVHYVPENTLKQNDPKETRFSFMVNPDFDATYPGGEQALNTYLSENAIGKIPENTLQGYALAAVQFTVTENGKIIEAEVIESTENEKVDQMLLETVANMTDWKPAEYANGTTVEQQYVLMVGNKESCTINTLNVRQRE